MDLKIWIYTLKCTTKYQRISKDLHLFSTNSFWRKRSQWMKYRTGHQWINPMRMQIWRHALLVLRFCSIIWNYDLWLIDGLIRRTALIVGAWFALECGSMENYLKEFFQILNSVLGQHLNLIWIKKVESKLVYQSLLLAFLCPLT